MFLTRTLLLSTSLQEKITPIQKKSDMLILAQFESKKEAL